MPNTFRAGLPLGRDEIFVAHGGVLTGHWEFDLTILAVFLGVVAYSFLLPMDSPRGIGRVVIYTITLGCLAAALVLAVMGFRSMVEGT